MSSAEFAEWVAYDRLSPINHTELLTGQLLTAFINVHRDPKAHPQPWTVEEVMQTPAARAAEMASPDGMAWADALAAMRAAKPQVH